MNNIPLGFIPEQRLFCWSEQNHHRAPESAFSDTVQEPTSIPEVQASFSLTSLSEEEKLAAFEKLMAEFSVPLEIMRYSKQPMTEEDVYLAVIHDHTRLTLNSLRPQAKEYTKQLMQLHGFMSEYKDKPLDFTNFGPWALFQMLEMNQWEGEKRQELLQALKDKILNSPAVVKRHSFACYPNLFLSSSNYRQFFNNVNYEQFSEEEKKVVFNRMFPEVLLDPDFINYLVSSKGENFEDVIVRSRAAIESLADRCKQGGVYFQMMVVENRLTSLGCDTTLETYCHLAALCLGNEELTKKVREGLKKGLSASCKNNLPYFDQYLKTLDVFQQISWEAAKQVDKASQGLHSFLKFYPHTHPFPLDKKRCSLGAHISESQASALANILTANPQWIKHFEIKDLLRISDQLPKEEVSEALCSQLTESKALIHSLDLTTLKKIRELLPEQTSVLHHRFVEDAIDKAIWKN